MGQADLAGAAHLELVSGVVQLRPEDATVEAMLRGGRAQQTARGLQEETVAPRERLVRRFVEFTNEYPWHWLPGHVDEWTQSLTAEAHLAPSTIRGFQTELRLFTEYLCDARYGWIAVCEKQFGPGNHPVPICHEWNTIAHLNDYEGRPEARAFTRAEIQRFLDYADDQVERLFGRNAKGPSLPIATRQSSRSSTAGVCGARKLRSLTWLISAGIRRLRSSGATGCSTSATARPRGDSHRGVGTCYR